MKKLGLEKLVNIIRFVPSFETLNYDVRNVKEFADLKLMLEELGIDRDKLKMQLRDKGFLERENQRVAKATEEAKLENRRIIWDNIKMSNWNSKLKTIDQVLRTSLIPISCKSCGIPSFIKLEMDVFYKNMIANNLVLPIVCQACGYTQRFRRGT